MKSAVSIINAPHRNNRCYTLLYMVVLHTCFSNRS